MFFFKRFKIRDNEIGLLHRDGVFQGLLEAGVHRRFDPRDEFAVVVADQRAPFLVHDKLDVIVKSGVLKGLANVVDLRDDQRALVWIDRRFARILGPGLHVYWTNHRDVRVEVVAVRSARFEHEELKAHHPQPDGPRGVGDGRGQSRLRGRAVPRRSLRRDARPWPVGVLEGRGGCSGG